MTHKVPLVTLLTFPITMEKYKNQFQAHLLDFFSAMHYANRFKIDLTMDYR